MSDKDLFSPIPGEPPPPQDCPIEERRGSRLERESCSPTITPPIPGLKEEPLKPRTLLRRKSSDSLRRVRRREREEEHHCEKDSPRSSGRMGVDPGLMAEARSAERIEESRCIEPWCNGGEVGPNVEAEVSKWCTVTSLSKRTCPSPPPPNPCVCGLCRTALVRLERPFMCPMPD